MVNLESKHIELKNCDIKRIFQRTGEKLLERSKEISENTNTKRIGRMSKTGMLVIEYLNTPDKILFTTCKLKKHSTRANRLSLMVN